MPPTSCTRLFANIAQIEACRKKIKLNEKYFSHLSHILSLAGNEVRLKILFLLEEEGKLCPCDMADILGMTIPAVSQHLRKLKDKNLIASKRNGQTIYYSINANHLKILKTIFQIHIPNNINKTNIKTKKII